jgi:transposase-like protein
MTKIAGGSRSYANFMSSANSAPRSHKSGGIGKLTGIGARAELREADGMTSEPVSYRRHRFPAAIISHAVWLYHVFSLSLRDVELILVERGVSVTHESIRAWCRKFGAEFARRLRKRRPKPGDVWHLDEVFIRINGLLYYLWRAVDQHGVVLDILVQGRRSAAAAKRFFRRLLHGHKYKPRRLITDVCAATVPRIERSCPMSDTARAGI